MPTNKEPSAIGAALVYSPNEDLGKKRIIQLFFFDNTPPILTSIDCFGIVYKSLPPTQYIYT